MIKKCFKFVQAQLKEQYKQYLEKQDNDKRMARENSRQRLNASRHNSGSNMTVAAAVKVQGVNNVNLHDKQKGSMIVEMPKSKAKTGQIGNYGLVGVTGASNTIENDSEVEHELFAEGVDANHDEKNQLCETSSWESDSDYADDDNTS